MQYPNNDMDELFRRAAESYPLNTSTANWDKVHAMLTEEEKKEAPPSTGRLRWLFMILPFLFLGLRLDESLFPTRHPATGQETTTDVPDQVPADKNSAAKSSVTFAKNARAADATPSRGQAASAWPFHSQTFGLTTDFPQPEATWQLTKRNERLPSLVSPLPADAVAVVITAPLQVNSLPQQSSATAESIAEAVAADSLQQAATETGDRKDGKTRSQRKRFYAGIVGGPDISTVKFQQFSNVGFQAGVLIGYAFSNRFALETGALTARKFYFSDGEYYKPDGAYTPGYARLVSVDGNCRMVEIPLTLHYTFSQQKKQNWFAAAGVSSYLMQREDYSLDYLYPSSGSISTHRYTYTDKDQYWLANLQLSVGYESKLGSLGKLRIEPYCSLPLKGMGHGRLPISSLGIKMGFTLPQQ